MNGQNTSRSATRSNKPGGSRPASSHKAPEADAAARDLIRRAGEFATRQELEVHVVGGYVRDHLLGLPFHEEMDFAVTGDAPGFARDFAKKLGHRGRVTVYKTFGTASFVHDGIRLEFAATRRESYSPDSRNPEIQPASFGEDLARRDFTVNAIAIDCRRPDEIVDPFSGREDLEKRILRTPLDPSRTFRDDPLRILRAVRFAARLGFTIDPNTWEAMKREAHRLKIIVRERSNDEFFKILAADPPSRGLMLLHECGALAVIFPEIDDLAGIEQIGPHGHKDNLLHTFRVVDKVAEKSSNIGLRFAALVHDIGKPRTKRFEKGQGWTFHGHEHVGERMIRRMGTRYKWTEELTERTSKLVRLHMRPMNLQDEGVSDSAIRRLVVQAGDDIDDLLTLCRADITSGNAAKVKRYLNAFDAMLERMNQIEAKDALKAFQSPIRGDEIMARTGLHEGPRVGLIKTLIEEEILEGNIPNTREGAEQVIGMIVQQAQELPELVVLARLRELAKARAEGRAAAPKEK